MFNQSQIKNIISYALDVHKESYVEYFKLWINFSSGLNPSLDQH